MASDTNKEDNINDKLDNNDSTSTEAKSVEEEEQTADREHIINNNEGQQQQQQQRRVEDNPTSSTNRSNETNDNQHNVEPTECSNVEVDKELPKVSSIGSLNNPSANNDELKKDSRALLDSGAPSSMEPSLKSSTQLDTSQATQDLDKSLSSLSLSLTSSSHQYLIENNDDIRKLNYLCVQFISKQCSNNNDSNNSLSKSDGSEEQQTTNKITDSILQLLVTDDLSSIRSPESLKIFFLKYLHLLPPQINSEILSVLIAIVKKSVFHLESARGLLFPYINYITSDQQQQQSDNNNTKHHSASSVSLTKHFSREWVSLLVAHSCDVEELLSIFKSSEKDASLLNFIQQANIKQRNKPHSFFAFPGTKGSMMSLPPFQKWPIQLGWTFNTWFLLEPKACAQPYLFNFKTGKSGLGYSAHFTGNCLVLTSIRVKGKGVQHCVAYEFPSYKWIHCAITYHNKWRSSEIKVYVNGQLTANIDMPWQVQTSEIYDKCFIGGSGTIGCNDRIGDLNCFCGQMSAIYLFNEGLSATQICAIHRLGPSYMGQFKYSNESYVNLPPQICKTLYEEKLASSLFCLFTPMAVDSGTLCIQLAPFKSSTSVAAQNYFISAPHAALLGETKAIITQPISFTLQSLGCSKSLLPLLEVYARRADSNACTALIGFLCDLLESSPHWFANDIVQNNGFVLIACALATNSRKLLSEKLLNIFLNLIRTLLSTASTASDSLLLKHLMDNILLNPSLWIYAEANIQIKLYSYLANELIHGTRHGSNRYTLSSSNNQTNCASGSGQLISSGLPRVGNVVTTGGGGGASGSGSISSEDQHQQHQQQAANNSSSMQTQSSSIVADLLFGEIRRVSTVLQSLHALKYYYWLAEEKNINQKAKNFNLRPNINDLTVIRSHILTFIRGLISRANVMIPLDETQGLLNYLSSCSLAENLLDTLDILSELLDDNPTAMVSALDQKQGIRVIMTLIGSPSELIRIKAIRLLTLFLSYCSYKKKQEIMGHNNLFMLLCDRLRTYRPMSLKLYEALIDLMIEENCSEQRNLHNPTAEELHTSSHTRVDISQKSIVNSTIIKVIASLIHDERTSKQSTTIAATAADTNDQEHNNQEQFKLTTSKVDIRRLFINDLWNLIVNSRENRRIILQMSVWQHWLINLIVSTIDDSPLVRDQVLAIFRVLLYHAIRYEYGGWRVWIDTLAIIHAKVSFDEFCLQLNNEFKQQYQVDDDNLTIKQMKKQVDQKKSKVTSDTGEQLQQQQQLKEQDQQGQDSSSNMVAIVATAANKLNEEETSPTTNRQQQQQQQQAAIVSSISERILNESRGIEMEEEEQQQQAEQEEKKEDKRDDAVVKEIQEDNQTGSNDASHQVVDVDKITRGIDSIDLAPSRAYRRASVTHDDAATTPTIEHGQSGHDESGRNDDDHDDDQVHNSSNELVRQQSLTSIPLDDTNSPTNETNDLDDEFRASDGSLKHAPEEGDSDTGVNNVSAVETGIEQSQQANIRNSSSSGNNNNNNNTDTSTTTTTTSNNNNNSGNGSGNNNNNSSNKAQASPAFRIPEFKWGNILVKLLNDLLFSIECDLYHWRCMAKLTSLDAPPFAPKATFNASSSSSSAAVSSSSSSTLQVGSSGIGSSSGSGGGAQLSSSSSVATHLIQIEAILQKDENQIYITNVVHLVSQLADNIIIAAGGLLPLLADATGGTRTHAHTQPQQQHTSSTSRSTSPVSEPSDLSMGKSHTHYHRQSAANIVTCEGLTLAQASSLLYRLVAMVDMVIFAASHVNLAELEADKNTTCGGILRQCLRLACTVTVKNCLILRSLHQAKSTIQTDPNDSEQQSIYTMEFPKDMFDSYQGCSLLSANGLFDQSALTLDNTDLIANLEYSPHQTPNTSSMPSLLPFQTSPIRDPNKLLQQLDINRIQACIYHNGNSESRQSQFLALSSLYFISVLMVSKYRDIIEPKHRPANTKRDQNNPLSSSSSTSKESNQTSSSSSSSKPPPKSTTSLNDKTISSVEANLLTFGKMQPNSSSSASASASANNLTNMLTSRLENTLDSVCPLLKSIMCDFCSFLSRTLLGSHGQDLVNKEAERTFRRPNTSPVELVMLLCSQEWQNTLQKNAGLAFIELINEGRVLSHGMKDHIVRVAMEAEFILSRLRADDVAKHEHFSLTCSDTLAARLHEEVLINSLISSASRRDFVLYCKFRESLCNEAKQNYKLDIWEDDDRRKRRFVFDSWPNSSQMFYLLPPPSSSASAAAVGAAADAGEGANAAAAAALSSGEDSENAKIKLNNDKQQQQQQQENESELQLEKQRILDLQKTIDLDNVATAAAAAAETSIGNERFSEIAHDDDDGAEDEDDDVDDDDEDVDEDVDNDDDVDVDVDEEHCYSNSPHSDSACETTTPSRNLKKVSHNSGAARNQSNKQRQRQMLNLNNKRERLNATNNTLPLASEQQHNNAVIDQICNSETMSSSSTKLDAGQQQTLSQQHGQWLDYDDYDSVNDFTGSVIFATEASLIWSIYSIPGVLQITTNELYFEPNQNVTELIDVLKREQYAEHVVGATNTNTSSAISNDVIGKHQKSNKDNLQSNSQQQQQNQFRKIDLMALRYCDFLTNSNGKIQLADIKAIFSRHYLLQPNGLEIFLAQRTSIMFAFNDFDLVKRVVKYLPPVGVGIKYGIAQTRRASLMSPRQLFAASNMTQRWQRRETGNFQYLMFLNTIAGRTYQDFNQYPVFPWILTNYDSEQLDLTLPTNFRDLSKPVGALNSKRRDDIIERYQSWDNAKIPAFHYGTHYSTAAFTLDWLCRLRGKFNSSYLALQDERYEDESRLFLSLGDSWVSSLIGGQQNVKELIPEFFYLPEMFHSNLGLPDVELPPWAQKSAEQFVRMHRIALESELVSCQLHQWIDLIFGYKQRGPEAVNSVNTFYYLTYQGNVNLNMIKDPSLRDAIETQIKHFGQTPSQLTNEPHPPRFSALHASPMAFNSSNLDEINKVVKFPFNNSIVHISSCINNYIAAAASSGSQSSAADSLTTGTVQQQQQQHGGCGGTGNSSSGSINSNSQGAKMCPSSVLTITSNNQYQIHKWQAGEQSGHPFTLDPQLESSHGSGSSSSSASLSASNRRQLIDVDDLCSGITLKLISSCKQHMMANNNGDQHCCQLPAEQPSIGNNTMGVAAATANCTVDEIRWPCAHYIVTLNGKYIIMSSFYDLSFRVFTTENGKLCQVIYGHRAPITCIARSEGNAMADFHLATGSQDCSLLVWYWNERYAQVEGSGVSAVHNPLPKLTITGHQTAILSAIISAELGLIISGSKNLILVHTITSGESLLTIDVKLSSIADRSLRESEQLHHHHHHHHNQAASSSSQSSSTIIQQQQRPLVKDKQKTILEASMLGDSKDQQRIIKQQQEQNNNCCNHPISSSSQASTAAATTAVVATLMSAKDERITQLREICSSSDYYVTNLQLARELAFIVCVALPAPLKRNHRSNSSSSSTTSSSSPPPALLLTFNLKGSLMDSAPIGLAAASSSLKLGDTCVMTITRDGEHLILNDSPSTLKIYKTFGLQPIYAYNTNDAHPNASTIALNDISEQQNRIRSLALLDHRFILVGLDNGKLIVYNCDFKNL